MGKTYEALIRAEKEFGYTAEVPIQSYPAPLPAKVVPLAEDDSYQHLKSHLLSRYPNTSMKVILFAATQKGDGTSTIAANFAVTTARTRNQRVLLVDANLRSPSLHHTFNIDFTPGLSDLLAAGSGLLPHMVKEGIGNLWVLPCGRKVDSPTALFESQRFAEFIQTARDCYDYVILDAPSVLHSTEIRAMCAGVDGVILVLSAGKTKEQIAQKAKQVLLNSGAQICGVVLNRRKFYIPEWIYRKL